TIEEFAVGHKGRGLSQPGGIPEAGHFTPGLVAGAGAAIEPVKRGGRKEQRAHSALASAFPACRILDSRSSRWAEVPEPQEPALPSFPLFWKADFAPAMPALTAALASARCPLP